MLGEGLPFWMMVRVKLIEQTGGGVHQADTRMSVRARGEL